MSAIRVIAESKGFRANIAKDILDALEAAGYAVVELPKPTRTGDGDVEDPRASWAFGGWDNNLVEAWDDGSSLYVKAADFSWGRDISVREAREFAAALLAAADVAEADCA